MLQTDGTDEQTRFLSRQGMNFPVERGAAHIHVGGQGIDVVFFRKCMLKGSRAGPSMPGSLTPMS